MHADTRRVRRICVAVCAAPALALSSAVTANASSTPATAPPSDSRSSVSASQSFEVLNLVNQERKKAGCPALQERHQVWLAAAAHSDDMAKNKFLSHTGSDRSTPESRLFRYGHLHVRAWAENIAKGYSTPQKTVDGWMASTGHRANILNCAFVYTGVAVSQPGNYYTQVFVILR
jgi:uncharacterized protein YkwD